LIFERGASQASASSELERPSLALPALFATEYAVAKLLMSWGLSPVACIGHSMGEYVAACLAGVFSAADGMLLVAARGRLFETLPEGGMLSVALSEQELTPLLGSELSIAAINAPGLCVASGPVAAIESLRQRLTERDVDSTRIHISVAAHSQMLAPILAQFEAVCRQVRLSAPELPFVSNLTGTWIAPAEATDPAYWVRHLRSSVRFADGIAEILRGGERVLLEVGPGRTLSSLARQHPSSPSAHPTLRHPQESVADMDFLLLSLGKLWLSGARVPFDHLPGTSPRRVPLPGYPFESQSFWIEASKEMHAAKSGALCKKPDVENWFYAPSWKRAAITRSVEPTGPWLVFEDEAGLLAAVAGRLEGQRVIRVSPGESFLKVSDERYTMRVDALVDYESLFTDLARSFLSR
jgi:acyl transferase domain-containing protein